MCKNTHFYPFSWNRDNSGRILFPLSQNWARSFVLVQDVDVVVVLLWSEWGKPRTVSPSFLEPSWYLSVPTSSLQAKQAASDMWLSIFRWPVCLASIMNGRLECSDIRMPPLEYCDWFWRNLAYNISSLELYFTYLWLYRPLKLMPTRKYGLGVLFVVGGVAYVLEESRIKSGK